MKISELNPKSVWKHFEAINAIPRASTKEEHIIEYMISFGASLLLETIVDATGNVIIKKPGTAGRENDTAIVLQGHLDMVHQKTVTSNFDFDTQGIEMYIDNDWVKAKETTLGADNGIGVAAIMGVLSSNEIEHPPIEALFTIDEEMGMTGAMALTNEQLKGTILLNLDSEEDDEITIGCAGGVDVEITGNYHQETINNDYQYYEISVSGLAGGHSGVDIHLNHGNTIRIFANYALALKKGIYLKVSRILAGTLTNVIPRDLTSTVAIRKTDVSEFEKTHKSIVAIIQAKYQSTDKNLNITMKPINGSFSVVEDNFLKQLLEGIQTMPNGVFSMTEGMDDLVQTSNSVAKINVQKGAFSIACHTRSSVDAERDVVVKKIRESFPNGKTEEIGPYPGWEPNPKSKLLSVAKKCYQEINGVAPAVKSIHAGLECGIISEIYPTMEMISFGPNILGAHSPEERLQISSTQKFWKFLTSLLKEL
ncbi:aminoacyl-histidine dipeptidase [Lutibacter citreus]|uniref:aminoacyl-histidine dipeptidase n=1 Tax=Lutibacter citreus TaxID=2138210 RepID=UPI000DBE5214|nr:aminoacyl-histidine dipeptidase [Lutibacter citreus]